VGSDYEVTRPVPPVGDQHVEHCAIVPEQDVGRHAELLRPALSVLTTKETLRPLVIKEPWNTGELTMCEVIAEPIGCQIPYRRT